ncbi:MarR family winged helix-turn-helix transcriptional regulator [Leuconostoc falkenbergense]|uniref:MarR family winged helix-turn-helix transcriptional regulator n=1 Tax=Leuconostoc falkenbergense TaxID=2766470 RepID=UPI0024A8B36C|nr:MarR family transcriptional regulator [Leuconostoc falkenbergense]MDI6553815.1 MarR family transcriptional regulator [Leuconostoc falkenbergense]
MIKKGQLYDELCLSIYNTNRYFHRLYAELLGGYELSYLQYMSLLIIYKKEKAKLMDIGEELELSSNTLTPVIDRLVNKEWLIKVPSELDKRVKYLKISKSKRPVFEHILSDVAVVRDELVVASEKSVISMINENESLNKTLRAMILSHNNKIGEKINDEL